MKKIVSIAMGAILAFSLVACGNSGQSSSSVAESTETTTTESTVSTETEPTETEPTETESTDAESTDAESTDAESADAESAEAEAGKTLVVYYSATGNTKAVAEYIAGALDGDTLELTPVEPYTSADLSWTDESSRVSREHDDPSLRTVELTADTVENWDSYDTVFIGYPIWWGIAAWPVDGFVTANDFTGKTVIPFTTSASSGLGESGELLAEMAGTGDWQEGIRFSSGVSEEEVLTWVEGLGL